MTDAPVEEGPIDRLGPEQGGGPPALMPWTLIVEGEDWSADLEHGAWLPCVGDRIDFIADDGRQRHYRVKEIVHTLQSSASVRPAVRDGQFTPNSTVDGGDGGMPRELRAGLPQVIVVPEG